MNMPSRLICPSVNLGFFPPVAGRGALLLPPPCGEGQGRGSQNPAPPEGRQQLYQPRPLRAPRMPLCPSTLHRRLVHDADEVGTESQILHLGGRGQTHEPELEAPVAPAQRPYRDSAHHGDVVEPTLRVERWRKPDYRSGDIHDLAVHGEPAPVW